MSLNSNPFRNIIIAIQLSGEYFATLRCDEYVFVPNSAFAICHTRNWINTALVLLLIHSLKERKV